MRKSAQLKIPNEVVVFAFLLEPDLLLLADKLYCRCMVAELDMGR